MILRGFAYKSLDKFNVKSILAKNLKNVSTSSESFLSVVFFVFLKTGTTGTIGLHFDVISQ